MDLSHVKKNHAIIDHVEKLKFKLKICQNHVDFCTKNVQLPKKSFVNMANQAQLKLNQNNYLQQINTDLLLMYVRIY